MRLRAKSSCSNFHQNMSTYASQSLLSHHLIPSIDPRSLFQSRNGVVPGLRRSNRKSSLITFHQYDQYSTGKFLSYFLFTQQPHPVPYRSIGLELAYAITYHKIQSRTMNRVILDLHKWPGTLSYPLHFHFQPFPFSTLRSGHRNTPFI